MNRDCTRKLALMVALALAAPTSAWATEKTEATAGPAADKAPAPPASPADSAPAAATAAAPAVKEGTFEHLDAQSTNVYNLKGIMLPFVATCSDKKTRFDKLFCQALNERLKAQHQGKVYHLVAEPSEEGPLLVEFKAKPKPVMEVTVRGCLTCKEPLLDREGGDINKGRFFMVKTPRDIRIRRGKLLYELVDIDLGRFELALPEKTDAKRFAAEVLPHVRLDLFFRPEAGVTEVGASRHKYGVITFQRVGLRVYEKCSGDVMAADPPMAGKYLVDKTDLTCEQNQPKKKVAAPQLPATLPQAQVKEVMELVSEDLNACYEQFGVAGDVPANVVVAPTGKVKLVKVSGELAGTPTAACVERLVKNLVFPKFKGQDANLQWPFSLK